MNRSNWWIIPVAVVALLVAGGIGAAIASDHDRRNDRTVQVVTATNSETGEPTQVIQVDNDGRWGHGWGGGGFFPGFLLFPLLWIALIWFFVGGFWRRRGGGGPWGGRMDEWHRKQHEGSSQGTPPGPASA